jgi:hypothetical protein
MVRVDYIPLNLARDHLVGSVNMVINLWIS